MKVQAESFHLNGHIIGFRLQTQKLDSPYKLSIKPHSGSEGVKVLKFFKRILVIYSNAQLN